MSSWVKQRLWHVVQLWTGFALALWVTLAAGGPAAGAMLPRIVFGGSLGRPVVALTFDDGNDAVQVRTIFHILRANRVPATFFPFARAMTLDPALWRDIAVAGYPIGNHTTTHPDLVRLSSGAVRAEIATASTMIRSITGRASIPVFRPPYGVWNASVASTAAALGYSTLLLWDVDPRDWSDISAAIIAQRVLKQTHNGSVILLHAGPYHTAQALPVILAGLAARGFGFVTIPQLLSGDRRDAVILSARQVAALERAGARNTTSAAHPPPSQAAPINGQWQSMLWAGGRAQSIAGLKHAPTPGDQAGAAARMVGGIGVGLVIAVAALVGFLLVAIRRRVFKSAAG